MMRSEEFSENSLDHVVAGLVKTKPFAGGWTVQTPLIYPSGASVTVAVMGPSGSFTVSDAGLGFSEAFALDVVFGFGRAAKEAAEEFGVDYDKRRLFIPGVSTDKLGAAVKLVGNCSQAAVIRAADRANERKAEERADKLYSRLKRLFPNTAKQAQLPGGSTTEWTVDALVRNGDAITVFDAVTPRQNSVSATSTKFHDLALLDSPPSRCAVVENRREMGTLLAVLAQAGAVMEDAAPDQQLRQFTVAGHA